MTQKPFSANEINDMAVGLNRLARNLWWTWDQEAQDLFQDLSPRGWRNLFHNAVAVLHEVSDYELRTRLQDHQLAKRAQLVLRNFDKYLNSTDTWGHQHAPQLRQRPVAYFSAEFGFHETLPIAAGGLGVLAGDHAKSASDLGIGFVGLSLFYREGYFMQAINQESWQTEYFTLLNPRNLPIEPVLNPKGDPLVCSVGIATSQVAFKAWRANVGRNPVYLLDANLPENEQHYRDLTLHVYGGDSTTRIMQEILLGVGGVRLLRALGVQPSVYHLNEGHAAFLVLELIREKMAEGLTFPDALAATRQECLFTTHTPVEAGHDRFSNDLMHFAMHRLFRQIKTHNADLMALGRVRPTDEHEPFCMTVLALKASRAANAVSALHGEVSRKMWRPLHPNLALEEVPIGHVTNGVHLLGWMKGTVRNFWKRKLGCDWEKGVNTPEFWARVLDPEFITDEEIWALRYQLKREMIEFSRRRLLLQGERLGPGDFIAFDHLLQVDALTIGFARRFATYKRAPLVFQQFDRIVELVKDRDRPIQFVFAGKAHPRDDEGKKFIQHIIHLSRFSELKGHLIFLENYDMLFLPTAPSCSPP